MYSVTKVYDFANLQCAHIVAILPGKFDDSTIQHARLALVCFRFFDL